MKKFLIFVFLGFTQFVFANKLDSLNNALNNAEVDTTRFLICNELIPKYIYYNIDSAKIYLDIQNDLLIKNIFDSKTQDAFLLSWYNNNGIFNNRKGEHEKAISFYNKALDISIKTGDRSSEAMELNNIANIHYLQGNFLISLDYHLKALGIRKEINDTSGIAMSLGNIGLIHESNKEYNKAIDNYKKAKEYFTLLDNKRAIAWCNRVIGIAFSDQKKFIPAQNSLNESLNICRALNNREDVKFCLINLASIFVNKYEDAALTSYIDTARIYLEEIASLQKTQLNKRIQVNYLMFQAQILGFQKNYLEALNLLDSSLVILDEIDLKTELKNVYRLKSEIFEAIDKPSKSLEYYKKFKEISDTLFNIEKDKEIGRKTALFEYEEQLKIEKIRHLNEEKMTEAESQIQLLISLIVILILAMVSILFFYRYKRKTKLNNELKREKSLLINKYNSLESAYSNILENLNQIKDQSQDEKVIIEKPLPNWIKELSKRELEVLSCIAIGLTDKEIEDKLFISVTTVRSHCQRIYRKLLVKNRTEASNLAKEYGLI